MKRYLESMKPSDIRALKILLSFLLLVVTIWGIALPGWAYYREARTDYDNNLSLVRWINQNAHRVPIAETPTEENSVNLLQTLTETAKQSELAIHRVQPQEGTKVRVWLNDVNYEMLIQWLSQLSGESGIRIDSIVIDRTGIPGIVNAQCTLS